MQVKVTWNGNVHFLAIADSQHEVSIDGPPDLGGENRGTRPMELMLMGIAGCAATDVVHILKRSRQEVSSCNVYVSAERAEEEPKVFTKIHMDFQLQGETLDLHKVERAVSLSAEKYCSASILMQRAGVDLSHSVKILPTS